MSDKYSDQVFNYLMEEMLRGPKPPDLTVRIQDAWRSEQELQSRPRNRLVTAELVDTVMPVSTSSVPAVRTSASQVPISTMRRRRRARPSAARSIAVSVALIAASVALAFVGWQQFVVPEQRQPTLAENDNPSEMEVPLREPPNASSELELATLEDSILGLDNAVADKSDVDRSAEASWNLPKPGLPSPGVARSNDSRPASDSVVANPKVMSVEPPSGEEAVPSETSGLVKSERQTGASSRNRADAEIVGEINRRFLALWGRQDAIVSPPMASGDLAEKLHRQLSGKPLSELDKQRIIAGSVVTAEWMQQLLDSAAFDQYLADKTVRHWLRGSSWPYGSKANEVLTNAVAKQLAERSGWDQVVQGLIGGELQTDSVEDSTKNASSALVAGWSGGSNHRLVRRMGANFLNANLACVQCHDASGENYQHTSGQPWSSQESYWNLVGLFDGVNAVGDGYQGKRVLSDKQANLFAKAERTVFFDLPDGKVKALKVKLPDGTPWQEIEASSPRQAFASWLVASEEFDQAIVNQTWRMLFGRHLAPQALALEELASDQRTEILNFLAVQFRESGRDLKQLVSWILKSEPYQRATLGMARSEWLAANEQALQKLQWSETLFAVGSSLGASPESNSLGRSVQLAKKWSGTFGVSSDGVMLAQPDIAGSTGNRNRKEGNPPPMPPLSFAIHGQRFSDFENAYIRKLAESEALDWQNKAAHVILLSEYEGLWANNKALAADVLEHHAGDVEAALRTLLWSVKNSAAN